MLTACPKCGVTVESSRPECPACGVVFAKFYASRQAAHEAKPAPPDPTPQPAVLAAPSAPVAPPAADPPAPAWNPATEDRKGMAGTRGRTLCRLAALFLVVQLIGYAILAVISPLLGMASLPLLTPAFFATLILLVLARILVEVERIRDLAEARAASAAS